jgi:hypothetical protein
VRWPSAASSAPLAPAEETRIAQAAGPASAGLVARGRELFTTEKPSDDDLRDLVEFLTIR